MRSDGQSCDAPFFTVFTPTYNRAHTLHRVYDSLRAQTLRDFEWLIIDDGSTDSTSELIASWIGAADFPIRCIRQQNSGKHIAHNVAVREARGFMFAPLDSDDAMATDSLERIRKHWEEIPEPERSSYSGIGGLCHDQQGLLIGDRFPSSPFDSDARELFFIRKIRGEKWGVTRTDVFREFPFPDLAMTQFVPESIVGFAMAKRYRRRYFNEIFRIYYLDKLGIEKETRLSSWTNLQNSARGRLYYYAWLLNNEFDCFPYSPCPFVKAAVMLPTVAKISDESFGSVFGSIKTPSAKALVICCLPINWFVDRLYMKKSSKGDSRAT